MVDNYLKQKNLETEILLRYRYIVPWSKMIRKEIIDNNNITFDEVITANDVMFSTKLGYFMRNFEASKKEIYCVTKSKGSLTTTIDNLFFETRLKVFINYYNFLLERLDPKEFQLLKLNGRGYLVNTIVKGFGFKKFIHVYKQMKNNNVRIFDIRVFNPFWVIWKTILFLFNHIKKRKFYQKDS